MNNNKVIDALRRPPRERSDDDTKLIFLYLRQLDVFRILADGPLKSIAETARYERHPKDHILFRKGQSATCWFILISGSVLMNNQIYLPSGCFGKRSGMNLRRSSDCLVIQPSDMIVIDYNDVQRIPVRYNSGSATLGRSRANTHASPVPSIPPPLPHRTPQPYQYHQQTTFKTNGAGYSLRHSGDLAYEFHQQFAAQSNPQYCANKGTQSGGLHATRGGSNLQNHGVQTSSQLQHSNIHQPSSSSQYTPHNLPYPPSSSNPSYSQTTHNLPYSSPAQNAQTSIPVHRSYNPSPTRPFQTFVGVLPAEKPSEDFSDATLTFRNTLAQPNPQKRVPSPAPRSASISVCPKETGYTYHENYNKQSEMWQAAIPSTSNHFNRQFVPNVTSGNGYTNSNESQQKRGSIHESQLVHLTESFDSGVQLKSNSSSNSSQPPPPAPFIADNNMEEQNNDRFLAPSAQRINKMRVQLSRKNSDDSNSSIRMRSHSNAQSALLNARRFRGRSTASSSTTDGDEFSGLPETAVDTDDEDDEEESIPSHDFSYMELKDNVRECLEKEPAERNSDDIHVLMEFMQQMPALASLPLSIKRQLCLKMVFAVVPEAGTVILHHGERIDSWSVVVNGAVETVRSNGERLEYRLGDAFGAQPQPQSQYNDGDTKTLCDDCEFVLVEHQDYCSIMSTLDQHIEQENDLITGEIVREAERRVVGSQVALVIIKAKPDRLIQHLVDETDPTNMDENYAQDFFLMYRVFISDPTIIMHRLLEWFQDRRYREKVTCILLHWVNNHFNDFECSQEMLKLLDTFEQNLEAFELYHQQSLLNITCSVKSHPRQATLTRSNRDQELAFSIIGGNANHPDLPAVDGIFIAHVEPNSPAEKNGLKKGDEIIEANGQNFRTIALTKALDILRESTHLSLTIKSNMMNFKEMTMRQENGIVDHSKQTGTMGRYQKKSMKRERLGNAGSQTDLSKERNGAISAASSGYSSATATPASKASMFDKLKTMFKGNGINGTAVQEIDLATDADERTYGTLRTSRSNPDISSNLKEPQPFGSHSPALQHRNSNQFPEHAVKVYRSDQSFRFLNVFPDTTARQIVQMALLEFGMQAEATNNDQEWGLCECVCSVAEKRVFIKQRRLPDDLQNLAERVGLASRLYIKNNNRSETLLPDELAPEVMKEAKINLYALNAQFVAIQLTLQDFDIFSSIEATEYVDNLFQLESRYGWPKLQVFEDQFNREMWWVVTEICLERTVSKRAKTIKKFIKIARHCRDLRNFNSMFAIISGLEKPAVRRLSHTWERIPGKYMKMLADIQGLLDPSRNMSKYRQHLAAVSPTPPVIPIYPIMRKDLTFAHESKPTCCGALINFDKLRMIARIIRSVTMLCSVKYDLEFMSTQAAINEINGSGTVRKGANGANSLNGTVKSLGNLSRKKLYEQTLMRRKVKTYLAEMPIIDQENELDQLSLACEPGQVQSNAGQNSVPLARRRVPSPTPSSLSSHSNQSDQNKKFFQQHSKFGVESPQAIQKMLSLVQNSKIKPNGAQSQSPLIPPKKPTFSTSTLKRIPSFGAAKANEENGN